MVCATKSIGCYYKGIKIIKNAFALNLTSEYIASTEELHAKCPKKIWSGGPNYPWGGLEMFCMGGDRH